MTGIIAAIIGLIGVLASAVLGFLAGPNRHLKRLEATHELLAKVSKDEPLITIGRVALEEAFEVDAVRYRHRLRGSTTRRRLWLAVYSGVWLAAFGVFEALTNDEAEGSTKVLLIIAVATLLTASGFMIGWGIPKLVLGDDHKADVDYNRWDGLREEKLRKRVGNAPAPDADDRLAVQPNDGDRLNGPSLN